MLFIFFFVSLLVFVSADCDFNTKYRTIECTNDIQRDYFSNFVNKTVVKEVYLIGIDFGTCSVIDLRQFLNLTNIWASTTEPDYCQQCLCFNASKVTHNCVQIPSCVSILFCCAVYIFLTFMPKTV